MKLLLTLLHLTLFAVCNQADAQRGFYNNCIDVRNSGVRTGGLYAQRSFANVIQINNHNNGGLLGYEKKDSLIYLSEYVFYPYNSNLEWTRYPNWFGLVAGVITFPPPNRDTGFIPVTDATPPPNAPPQDFQFEQRVVTMKNADSSHLLTFYEPYNTINANYQMGNSPGMFTFPHHKSNCHGGNANNYSFDPAAIPFEYSNDTPLRYRPVSGNSPVIAPGIQSVTVFHGAIDPLMDSIINVSYRNIAPEALRYHYVQKSVFASHIYRFQDYRRITSPAIVNHYAIVAPSGQAVSFCPGFTDPEGDSLSIVPLLMPVAPPALSFQSLRSRIGLSGGRLLPTFHIRLQPAESEL